jgi:hypothetical protein
VQDELTEHNRYRITLRQIGFRHTRHTNGQLHHANGPEGAITGTAGSVVGSVAGLFNRKKRGEQTAGGSETGS